MLANRDKTTQTKNTQLYLWIDSEGWIRFGPFHWLGFKDNNIMISENGIELVKFDNNRIRLLIQDFEKYQVDHFEITSSPIHPYKEMDEVDIMELSLNFKNNKLFSDHSKYSYVGVDTSNDLEIQRKILDVAKNCGIDISEKFNDKGIPRSKYPIVAWSFSKQKIVRLREREGEDMNVFYVDMHYFIKSLLYNYKSNW